MTFTEFDVKKNKKRYQYNLEILLETSVFQLLHNNTYFDSFSIYSINQVFNKTNWKTLRKGNNYAN